MSTDQLRRSVRPLLARVIRGAAWGLADQALISAANFVTLVVLARELDPAEFGAFALAYTALLLLNGLQTALITQPHNVLGQWKLRTPAYVPYTAATGVHQALFALLFAGVVLLAAAATAPVAPGAATILGALATTLVAWQGQEFIRRVLYTERRLRIAFALDVVSYGGQIGLLVALALVAELSPSTALLVVAATSTVAATLGALFAGIAFARRFDMAVLRENWSFGKWLGAAIAASWLVAQIYLYLVAVVLGAPEAGELRAAQVVLGPVNAFLVFLATILPIQLAATRRARGETAFRAAVRRAFLLTAAPILFGCAVTAAFAERLLDAFYGGAYPDATRLVVLFAVYYAVMYAVFLLTAALTARGYTKALFRGSAVAGTASLLAGWPIVALWGLEGAVGGMIGGALLVALLFWRTYRDLPAAASEGPDLAVAGTRA